MTQKGIRKLDPKAPFAELFGVQADTDHVVRILCLSMQRPHCAYAVFERKEFRTDPKTGKLVERNRPPGWAMSGGMVQPNESPEEFMRRHERRHLEYGEPEYGEISFEIDVSSILYLEECDWKKDLGDRIECIHYFVVFADENRPIPISPEEGKEVSEGGFFQICDIFNAPTVDTRDEGPANMEPHPERGEFYRSHNFYKRGNPHNGHFGRAWDAWQNRCEANWREQQAAKAAQQVK